METQQSSIQASRSGWLGEIACFFAGFVLPLGSFTYYRSIAGKGVGRAILFLVLFMGITSLLASGGVGYTLASLNPAIREAFDNGSIPEIVIQDGVAKVGGPQPLIIFDDFTNEGRTMIAIDTTGKLREIDQRKYEQGLLLMKTEAHLLNDGRYQVLPLKDLHDVFETNPIVVNGESASRWWGTFSLLVSGVVFIFMSLWNIIVRLMFISMMAVFFWGGVSLFQKDVGFGPVLISGIYALVPSLYIHQLLKISGLSVIGLQTLGFVSIWLVVLFIVFGKSTFLLEERPPRLWRAIIGIPLLIVLALNMILTLEYGAAISWGSMILTILVLLVLGIIPLLMNKQDGADNTPHPSHD